MESEEYRSVKLLISARLSSGQLPRWHACVMTAGKGEGQACECCDKPITAAEVQYDAQLTGGRELSMHLRCYEVWRDETLRMAVALYSREYPPLPPE